MNHLHAEAFDHPVLDDDWRAQVDRYSLGWVCARRGAALVGFVNVAFDGGVHAFILDTMVAASSRRCGIATRLIGLATAEARAAGCEWLHVDFDTDELGDLYLGAGGFVPTPAGVIDLTTERSGPRPDAVATSPDEHPRGTA